MSLHYVEGALVRSEIIPNDVIPIVVTLTSVIELNKLELIYNRLSTLNCLQLFLSKHHGLLSTSYNTWLSKLQVVVEYGEFNPLLWDRSAKMMLK